MLGGFARKIVCKIGGEQSLLTVMMSERAEIVLSIRNQIHSLTRHLWKHSVVYLGLYTLFRLEKEKNKNGPSPEGTASGCSRRGGGEGGG